MTPHASRTLLGSFVHPSLGSASSVERACPCPVVLLHRQVWFGEKWGCARAFALRDTLVPVHGHLIIWTSRALPMLPLP